MILVRFIGTGYGEVTYNARRNLLGAISVHAKTAYYLFNIEYNGGSHVKLSRKSAWHKEYDKAPGTISINSSRIESLIVCSHVDNSLPGFEFDPNGEFSATVDIYGNCVVSDLSSNKCISHLKLGKTDGNTAQISYYVKFLF